MRLLFIIWYKYIAIHKKKFLLYIYFQNQLLNVLMYISLSIGSGPYHWCCVFGWAFGTKTNPKTAFHKPTRHCFPYEASGKCGVWIKFGPLFLTPTFWPIDTAGCIHYSHVFCTCHRSGIFYRKLSRENGDATGTGLGLNIRMDQGRGRVELGSKLK